MKIGVNSRIYGQSGSGIPYYIKNLYQKLQEIDRKNDYIFFQTNNKKILGKTVLAKAGVSGLSAAFFDWFIVEKLLKKRKIDVFHATSFILPFFKPKGVKYVVTIHDLAFLALKNEPNDYSFFYQLFSKFGIGHSLRIADAIVADSKSTKKDIVKYFNLDPKKIEVVYLGLNEEILKSPTRKAKIKGKYIFSVSTNPKRKNTLGVLRAFAKSRKFKNIKYVIAGLIPRAQRQELGLEIKRLKLSKRVQIIGYVNETELRNLYQNAQFFVYPSFYEGFGFPVIEAVFCKCPVITSQTSSMPELLPNKEWLVDPYNLDDIQNKMEKMLNLSKNQRVKLIQNNLKFAQRFRWENSARKMLNIFNRLENDKK